MSVIELHPKPELAYWRCDCGCMTFYARNDEELECAMCEKLSSNGFWKLPEGETREEQEDDPPAKYRVDTGDDTSALDRVLRFIKPEATDFVAVVLKNGTVHAWGQKYETRDRRGWLRRKLSAIRDLLVQAS